MFENWWLDIRVMLYVTEGKGEEIKLVVNKEEAEMFHCNVVTGIASLQIYISKFLKLKISEKVLRLTLIEALRSVQPVTLDREQLVQAGWVSVVQVVQAVSPDLVYVQTDSMVDKVWRV